MIFSNQLAGMSIVFIDITSEQKESTVAVGRNRKTFFFRSAILEKGAWLGERAGCSRRTQGRCDRWQKKRPSPFVRNLIGPRLFSVQANTEAAMARERTEYETGARKYPARTGLDPSDDFSPDAASNKPPAGGMGLTRPADQTKEETHQSGGRPGKATPSPATEKTSGAGPTISEHSKDAKSPRSGRQPGAYVKD
ncbi:hypothetical protein [Mesorhizobium salmacidum]|uniref:Uncharacterized protein n=1 Tax=Mesorhizobium salmacidum TaxID=3015171 RepID=A0ABU8KVM0_9HYPH